MLNAYQLPPPAPSDPQELARVEHTRMRRRILYGLHRSDVEGRLASAIGTVRREAWGPLDMSSNPPRAVYDQLARLYDDAPRLTIPAGGEPVAAAVDVSGYWQGQQRVGRDTLALREMLVRVDVSAGGTVHTRPVPPDLVNVEVDPMRPDQPIVVREWVHSSRDPTKWIQIVADARAGSYYALDAAGRPADALFGPPLKGDAYPFRGRTTGRPRVPYVTFHAAMTGEHWDAWTGQEVWEGTLQLAVFYSFYSHILRAAAWKQRYALGAEPIGEEVEGQPSRAEIVTDPATLLLLRPTEEFHGQPIIDQFAEPSDPEKVLNSIIRYERRLVDMAAGVPEVTRESSDIRSGYSLAVARERQREEQRRYRPLFRRSDVELLGLVADLMGGPVEGWDVDYQAIPRDEGELRAEAERMAGLVNAGLMSRVDAFHQLNPHLSRAEAAAALAEIAAEGRPVFAAR